MDHGKVPRKKLSLAGTWAESRDLLYKFGTTVYCPTSGK